MKEGFYLQPAQAKEHYPKIAVIIATFIRNGQVEYVGGRRKDPKYHDSGLSHIAFTENKLDMLRFNLACHKHYSAGADYDLIIVDNSSDDPETKNFLKELESVKVFTRPNTGFSFGAYRYAWQTFGDKYDYYLFCEQDITPVKDGWLQEIINKFLLEKDIGAVGNVVDGLTGYRGKDSFETWGGFNPEMLGKYWNVKDFRQCNLDGMFLFTSSRVLKEVDDVGGLNVIEMKLTNKNDYDSWEVTPGINELLWHHPILDLGYKVSSFHDGERKYTHGICYVDFDTAGDYAPLMHAQVLYCNEEMREHYSWYNELNKFKLEMLPNIDSGGHALRKNISNLITQLTNGRIVKEIQEQDIARITGQKNVFWFTKIVGGEVVSFCSLYIIELLTRKLGVIEEVITKEECRKNGYATELIKQAVDKARELKCDCVELTVREDRPEIQEFYNKLGFVDRKNKSFRLQL